MSLPPGTPRWSGILDPRPRPHAPFIADIHSFDIVNTIRALVRNVPEDVIGIVLVDRGGPQMRAAAEEEAKARGITILWEDRVHAAAVSILAGVQ